MDGIVPAIVELIKDAPGYFALTVGFIAVVFALYLKVRSINIDEITSISKLQSDQVGKLLIQVSQLSKDLASARKEISTLYNKIDELESVVRLYRNKLRDVDVDVDDFFDTKSPEGHSNDD